ncbi:MAG: tRNA-specific 2-thiouridylase [Planctomycetaceae bacterium]|nr:tRNA-specific 2-thiouridylase [Planctomycetaceae bacterium]
MRVVLAMSGGVDSSASALLLQRQGHEVVGLFMRSGATEEACATDFDSPLPIIGAKSHKQGCCSAADAADARRVADRLDIPFHALNFQEEFGRIKDYFADEYLAGRTPNPCVMCNVWLKFGRLWEFAQQVGAEAISTGHYARVAPLAVEGPDQPANEGCESEGHNLPFRSMTSAAQQSATHALYRGLDQTKDQSYVLFGINPDLLPRILFPVGSQTKAEIRELAREAGLNTADKPDSQEICFIPDNDYAGFLTRYRGETETAGELVDTSGRVVGRHDGFERFTIGQRRGLGVTFGAPRFVVRIEPETRRVVIGNREELGRTSLDADRLNWLGPPPRPGERFTAQIRYQHTPASCSARLTGEDQLTVEFDEPQFGVAPGQAVVLYDGDRVVGGGWIR